MTENAAEIAQLGLQMRTAFRGHPAGVAVITAVDAHGPVGLLASSLISVSLEPPILAMSVSSLSESGRRLSAVDQVMVHLLGSDDIDLAEQFSRRGSSRFGEGDQWTSAPTGEPVLPVHGARLHGRVNQRIEAGQGTILVVEVDEVTDPADDLVPLAHVRSTWHRLG